MAEISEKTGYKVFSSNDCTNSNVYHLNGDIFKVSTRNSIWRMINDFQYLKKFLSDLGCPHKIQDSLIFKCTIENGKKAICVQQKIISGKTIAELGKAGLQKYLEQNNQEIVFLKALISMFHCRVESHELYPDIVGNPDDQSI